MAAEILRVHQFPEEREGRVARHRVSPARSDPAREIHGQSEVHSADLFVEGRGPRREIQGEVPRAGTDYITIQRRFEYASNDIR